MPISPTFCKYLAVGSLTALIALSISNNKEQSFLLGILTAFTYFSLEHSPNDVSIAVN
jgi:hypothetical protein